MPASTPLSSGLVNKDIAANYSPAGGVPITELDGEEVVCARESVIDHIDGESCFLLTGAGCSHDMGMVTNDGESGDAATVQ